MTQSSGRQVPDQGCARAEHSRMVMSVQKSTSSFLHLLHSLEKYWQYWENLGENTLRGVLFKH